MAPRNAASPASRSGPLLVAAGVSGLSAAAVEIVARLAGTGADQHTTVRVVHVARVWGTGLGIQHPSLQSSATERTAALDLRGRGVDAEALVISGRDVGKALAGAAQRSAACTIVVGRGRAGRLERLLRGPDPARALMGRTACTLVMVDFEL